MGKAHAGVGERFHTELWSISRTKTLGVHFILKNQS